MIMELMRAMPEKTELKGLPLVDQFLAELRMCHHTKEFCRKGKGGLWETFEEPL